MIKSRTDAEVVPLGDGITRINEYDFANCFLVEGEESACLIDTGDGICDLPAILSKLTDKKITVLITHAHADHVGGICRFDEAFVHPLDLKRAKKYAKGIWRAYFLYCHRYKKNKHGVSYREAFIKPRRCVLKTMKEGDAFDLGGRKIEVYLTPGHSAGSVTLRDTLTGTLFTGDNVNPMVTLQYPGSAGLKAWIESAEKTLSLAGQAPIWGGHGGEAIEPRMIRTAIGFAEKLLKDPPKRRGVVTVQGEEKYPKLVARARRS